MTKCGLGDRETIQLKNCGAILPRGSGAIWLIGWWVNVA